VGGHCIPVDPIYFSFAASKVGESAKFIDLANDLNKKRPIEVARQLNNEFSLIGKKVQVIGISYKTNSSDTRETPVFSLISELRRIGSQVIWHDPLVNNYLGESSEPLQIVDLGIICNPHNEIDFTFWKKNKIHVIDLSTSINSKFKKYF
jgi:UDP-N-acetyl-D-glucosamine dehydrogenase